jgi:hypothetical protein
MVISESLSNAYLSSFIFTIAIHDKSTYEEIKDRCRGFLNRDGLHNGAKGSRGIGTYSIALVLTPVHIP